MTELHTPCVTPRDVRDIVDAVDIVFGTNYTMRNPILLGTCLAAIIGTNRGAAAAAEAERLRRFEAMTQKDEK